MRICAYVVVSRLNIFKESEKIFFDKLISAPQFLSVVCIFGVSRELFFPVLLVRVRCALDLLEVPGKRSYYSVVWPRNSHLAELCGTTNILSVRGRNGSSYGSPEHKKAPALPYVNSWKQEYHDLLEKKTLSHSIDLCIDFCT